MPACSGRPCGPRAAPLLPADSLREPGPCRGRRPAGAGPQARQTTARSAGADPSAARIAYRPPGRPAPRHRSAAGTHGGRTAQVRPPGQCGYCPRTSYQASANGCERPRRPTWFLQVAGPSRTVLTHRASSRHRTATACRPGAPEASQAPGAACAWRALSRATNRWLRAAAIGSAGRIEPVSRDPAGPATAVRHPERPSPRQ